MTRAWPRREALSSRLRPVRSQRGSVAVSVILIPLAFLAVFSTIQVALIIHGRNVVAAAAEDALFTAAQFGADEDDGEAAAEQILALHNGVEVEFVEVDKGDETVTVIIRGQVAAPLNLFSGFEIGASGPVEKFYLESER